MEPEKGISSAQSTQQNYTAVVTMSYSHSIIPGSPFETGTTTAQWQPRTSTITQKPTFLSLRSSPRATTSDRPPFSIASLIHYLLALANITSASLDSGPVLYALPIITSAPSGVANPSTSMVPNDISYATITLAPSTTRSDPHSITISEPSMTTSESMALSYSSTIPQTFSTNSIPTEITVILSTLDPSPSTFEPTTDISFSTTTTSAISSSWSITSTSSSLMTFTSTIPTSVDSQTTTTTIDLTSSIFTVTSSSSTLLSSQLSIPTSSISNTKTHSDQTTSSPLTSSATPSVTRTSSRFITVYTYSTTTQHNSELITSTSLGPGVLSTNGPKGSNSFARNTEAIVGVAVAGFCAVIITVVVIFFACKRYKRKPPFKVFRHTNGMHFVPWHPPLAGDDEPYNAGHSTGSFQHLPSTATHTNEMSNEHVHSGTELMGAPQRTLSSSEGHHPHQLRSTPLSPHSLASDHTNTFSYVGNWYAPPIPPPSSWFGAPGSHLDGNWQNNRDDARSSMPSLHAGSSNGHVYRESSSHGHFYPVTSSHGHLYPSSSSHGHTYATSSHGHAAASTASEHQFPASKFSIQRPPTSFKNFIGRLSSSRGSLPNIIISNSSSKSSSRESLPLNNPLKQKPSSLRLSTLTLNRFSKSKLEPMQSTGSWQAPHPPLRVPSPAATEDSRMLEDLLIPQLGTRVASSEHSSSASLRDHVDYSRPISGAIRNRVHSTMTFSTDTGTMLDEKEPTV